MSRHFRYDGGPHGGEKENLISPAFIAWVLKQWWLVVIPAGLVLAALAGIIVMCFYTPKYEATAILLIEESSPYVAFSSRDNGGQSQRYVQTQVELLRSPVVLEPVLSRSEIAGMEELADAEDRVNFLRKRLAIKQVGQSELYNISYTSPYPEDAAKLVNAIIAEYVKNQSGEEFRRSQQVIDILEEERKRRELVVEKRRREVVELAKQVTGQDPFGGKEVDVERAMSPVSSLFASLTQADLEIAERSAELESLQNSLALSPENADSSGLLDLEIANRSEIIDRLKQIKEVEAAMEAVKLRATTFEKNPNVEKDPAFVALRSERDLRQKDLNEAKLKARESVILERKNKRQAEIAEHQTRLKRELELLKARQKKLNDELAKQKQELQTGGGRSVELEFARAELEREDKVFELIASRKLALQTELRAPARVQPRKKADVPILPVEPIPYKLLFLACSAAFVAPFGMAVLWEITVGRISDVEQLAQESGLRVLGEVASLPVRHVAVSPTQLSGRLRRATYIFAESINSLRTNLALAEVENDQQVMAVTSAAPSEGKTSVAVSLAMSIANATKQPTLVIDGDMRSPVVASMLKAKNQPGLFEVLSNKCELDEAIQRVGDSQLYVIPGGRATRSTHSVVGMAEVKGVLDQVRRRFPKIVIDTPPILGASESLVLAKAADSVLFCSLCDVSTARKVRLAIDRLSHAQVNIAGAVLSGMPARRYEYVYGYYANRIETGE